jgi:hypothetical protein
MISFAHSENARTHTMLFIRVGLGNGVENRSIGNYNSVESERGNKFV